MVKLLALKDQSGGGGSQRANDKYIVQIVSAMKEINQVLKRVWWEDLVSKAGEDLSEEATQICDMEYLTSLCF